MFSILTRISLSMSGKFLDPDAYMRRMEKDASLMAADQAAMKQRAIDRGMDTPENFGQI